MAGTQIVILNTDGPAHYDMAEADNPCFACHACCRHYRVSFYHGELDCQPGGQVPADMAVPITPFLVAMRGTERGHGACIALQPDGRCGIYARRPSPCREFRVLEEDGRFSAECRRLRTLYGVDT